MYVLRSRFLTCFFVLFFVVRVRSSFFFFISPFVEPEGGERRRETRDEVEPSAAGLREGWPGEGGGGGGARGAGGGGERSAAGSHYRKQHDTK